MTHDLRFFSHSRHFRWTKTPLIKPKQVAQKTKTLDTGCCVTEDLGVPDPMLPIGGAWPADSGLVSRPPPPLRSRVLEPQSEKWMVWHALARGSLFVGALEAPFPDRPPNVTRMRP